MKKLRNIILTLSVLSLSVSLYGCADKNAGSSDSKIILYDDSNSYVNPNDKFSETNSPAEITEGKMGVKTAFKDCEINLTKIVFINDINTDSSSCYAAIFEITNKGSEEMNVSALSDFTVQADGAKTYYGSSVEAEAAVPYVLPDIQSISTTIKAGETAEGYISIQIPSSWENLKISYVPSQDNESRDAVVYNVTTDMVTEQ